MTAEITVAFCDLRTVVIGDVEPETVVVGNPVRVLRHRGPPP